MRVAAGAIVSVLSTPVLAQSGEQVPFGVGDMPSFAPGDALAGEAAAAFAAGECPTYGMLRRSKTAHSAPYPLPDLPGPFAEGCVYGLDNGSVQVMFVLPKGESLQPVDAPFEDPRLAMAPPLYGHVPILASETALRDANARLAAGGALVVQRLVEPGDEMRQAILEQGWDAPVLSDRGNGTQEFMLRGTALIVEARVAPEGPEATMKALLPLFAGNAREWRNSLRPGLVFDLPQGATRAATTPADPLSLYTPMGTMHAAFERSGDEVEAFWYHPNGFAQCAQGTLNGTVIEGPWAERRTSGFPPKDGPDYDLAEFRYVLTPLDVAAGDDALASDEAVALRAECFAALEGAR